MDANTEELEKRMGIKIEAVRDMMLDRFSGVDKKLTAIEQLLKKIIVPQSQTGNSPENRWNLIDKNTGGGGTESSEKQDEGKKVAIGGGDDGPSHESGSNRALQAQISSDGDDQETDAQIQGLPGGLQLGDRGRQDPSHKSWPNRPLQAQISSDGDGQETDRQIRDLPGGLQLDDRGRQGPSHESGPDKPLQAQISSDGDDQETDYQIRGPPGGLYLGDRGRQGPPWEAGSSGGWVGLYTNHYGTYNPPGPHYSFGTDFCGPAWVGPKETDFSKKNGPRFEAQRVNTFVEDCPETEGERVLEGYGSKVVNADVTGRVRKKIQYDIVKGLNYSGEKGVKTGQDGSYKESSNKPQAQVVTKGSNKGRPKTRRGKRKADKADVNGTKNSCTGSLGKKVVKTDQDDKVADNTVAGEEDIKDDDTDVLLQDSSKTDQWAKNESDLWGKAIENETNFIWRSFDNSLDWSKLVEAKVASQHGSGAPWGKKGDNKSQAKAVTDGSNEKGNDENQKPGSWWSKEEGCGSSKPDQWAKNDSDSWGKAIENETNFIWRSSGSDKNLDWSKLAEEKVASQHGSGAPWGKKGDNKSQAKAVTDGSNEKGNDENQKPGSWWSKEEGCGSKRKHPDSLVGGPNDGPISSGLLSTSKRRADMFTTDEQDIHLNEIEPIVQSIRRIMNRYNDGDPLSADDQAYIIENVFNHHPQKAQKIGSGVDYIMVSKHMKFQESRCFYVVSTDGRKEDFSYHKCLKNFASGKYPNKVDELKSS